MFVHVISYPSPATVLVPLLPPGHIVTFIRMHPNLVFLWHQGRNFRAITGDCKLATPINVGQETGLLSTRFLFHNFSVSDEPRSVIDDYL